MIGITPEQALKIHKLAAGEGPASFIEACNYAISLTGLGIEASSDKQARELLFALVISLLNENRKTEAALILWGGELFDPRPRSVQMIWEDMEKHNKLLIIGHGSAGKSYTLMAWALLDWIEDPWGTSTKLVSTTAGHAQANTFSTLTMFHKESILVLPGIVKDAYIGMGGTDKRASIAVVALPTGDEGRGRLQGFHPIPRKNPHPKFGNKTRVRVIMDEAEGIPNGVWQGVDNMLITQDDDGSVKAVGATNPRDRGSIFGQRVTPLSGWASVDIETSDRWEGQEGWWVLRLDGLKSENVVLGYEKYMGLITLQGFNNFVAKGTHHPEYHTMGRGWYPEQMAEFVVVSPQLFDNSQGTYIYTGDIIPVASFDPAFSQGGDDPIITTGKWGKAIGFQPMPQAGITPPLIDFQRRPVMALQMEQQFSVQKSIDPTIMGKSVMDICRGLGVRPEWFCMDNTGNGLLLYGYLVNKFGSIMGVQWGSEATEKKIILEDTKNAYERYIGINTEMYFAFGYWLQYGFIKFSPMLHTYEELKHQIMDRRYGFRRGLQHLEDKPTFKARNMGKSPDHGDSGVMLVHLVRVRTSEGASMLDEPAKPINAWDRSKINKYPRNNELNFIPTV